MFEETAAVTRAAVTALILELVVVRVGDVKHPLGWLSDLLRRSALRFGYAMGRRCLYSYYT